MKVADEHLAMQPLRRHRAEQRPAQHVVIDVVGVAKDFPERRGRAVHFDGRHQTVCKMHAMGAPARLDELQRPARGAAMKRAEQIPQRRRLEPARQLHPSPVEEAPKRAKKAEEPRAVGRILGRRARGWLDENGAIVPLPASPRVRGR